MTYLTKVALGVTFVVGVILGNAFAPDVETVTEYKVIHDTETVTETQTIEVPVAPQECHDLVTYTVRISNAGGRLDEATSRMLDIMSRLRIAVATSDSNAANDLETEVRLLSAGTTGATETMGETQPYFEDAAEACLKGLK